MVKKGDLTVLVSPDSQLSTKKKSLQCVIRMLISFIRSCIRLTITKYSQWPDLVLGVKDLTVKHVTNAPKETAKESTKSS